MANINKYIKVLLHPAGCHQGSHKAYQAGNQSNLDRMIKVLSVVVVNKEYSWLNIIQEYIYSLHS